MTPPTDARHEYRRLQHYQSRVPGHRGNHRVHYSTLLRWVTAGLPTPSGERVKLRAVRLGATWCTTDEWFDEFVAVLTASALPAEVPTAPVPTPAARRAAGALDAELRRRGA